MKAVVTGGAGFIGSHMVDLLVKENFEVTVIDNLANGRLDNLEHHKGKIKFAQVDIGDYNTNLDELFEDVEYVFHYAALADIVPSINEPLKYHQANVDGTINVLQAAKKSKNLKSLCMLHRVLVMVSLIFIPHLKYLRLLQSILTHIRNV